MPRIEYFSLKYLFAPMKIQFEVEIVIWIYGLKKIRVIFYAVLNKSVWYFRLKYRIKGELKFWAILINIRSVICTNTTLRLWSRCSSTTGHTAAGRAPF